MASLYGGRHWLKEKATRKAFLENASRAQILHLSMHAEVDDADPLASRFVFYQPDNPEVEDPLQVEELYTLELPASLVVLNACETGLGELKRGKGSSAWQGDLPTRVARH